jgi:site-specific recombinase XerD
MFTATLAGESMINFTKGSTAAEKQVEEYLHYCEFIKRFAPHSIRTYRKTLSRFIGESGTKDFRKLSNKDLDKWHIKLAQEGKAAKTINNYKDGVISCLKYLDKHGKKVKIVFDLIERAEEGHKEAQYFKRDEIKAIKDACKGLRELLLISLLYDSGIRIGELRRLRVEDVSGLTVKIIQGKGRKDRTTFILQATRTTLDRWLNLNEIETGYLFPSPAKFEEPLSEQQIRESVNAPIRRAGFEKGSAHTMRHSFVTNLIDADVDVFTAQTLAGHSDPKTTRHYFHTNIQKLGEKYSAAMAKLA